MVAPTSGLGPWDGTQVPSQQSPILHPGRSYYSTQRCLLGKVQETLQIKFVSGCSIRVA